MLMTTPLVIKHGDGTSTINVRISIATLDSQRVPAILWAFGSWFFILLLGSGTERPRNWKVPGRAWWTTGSVLSKDDVFSDPLQWHRFLSHWNLHWGLFQCNVWLQKIRNIRNLVQSWTGRFACIVTGNDRGCSHVPLARVYYLNQKTGETARHPGRIGFPHGLFSAGFNQALSWRIPGSGKPQSVGLLFKGLPFFKPCVQSWSWTQATMSCFDMAMGSRT